MASIKKSKLVLIVCLTIIFVLIILALLWGRNLIGKTKTVLSYVDELQTLADSGLNKESIQDAIEITEDLSPAINDLRTEIDPILPVIHGLGKLPRIGGYFNNVEPMLNLASNLANTVMILGRAGQPLIEGNFSNSEKGNQLLAFYEYFLSSQTIFSEAENYFRDAQDNLQQVDSDYIPAKFQDEISKIDEYMQLSSHLFDALKVVPRLLGSDGHATYLIMIQNKDEIRPSGGFITGFGILQIKEGRILVLKIYDSTTLNYVSEVRDPAFPLKELMFAFYLVPRDANWSPDFPTAAQETQEIYQLSTDIETDGVIAFDQLFMVKLLEFLGPLSISDEIGEINAENFEEKMIEYKQLNWDDGTIQERKDFLSILAPTFLKEIFKKNQFSDLVDLAKSVLDEMQSGHLSIFFNDPDSQKIIEDFEVDGAVRPGIGDYIMLIDSNIGFGKIDLFIERSLNYSIDLSDPTEPKGKLIINYRHTSDQIEECFQGRRLSDYDLRFRDYYFPRCYWDYWRILLQKDTEIEDVNFTEVPLEYFHEGVEWDQTPAIGEGENGTTEVGGLIVVPQASEQTVELVFKPARNTLVDTGDGGLAYSLRIQKQNGLDILPIKIQVSIPQGYGPINVDEGWINNSGDGVLIWEGEIDRTIDLTMNFAKSELGKDKSD